jgi:hypothetical protein
MRTMSSQTGARSFRTSRLAGDAAPDERRGAGVAERRRIPEWRNMRCLGKAAACVVMALSVAGCDPVLERRYITEGAGIDLYTSDRADQSELLRQYMSFVCVEEGVGPTCDGNWTLFVQAGMNDIDLRCDGFLTWIDAKRRDKEPVLAELSAINTAVHAVMTVTGSSPKSLDIVTAAFGLASASYNNWNSRLLISVNQSTIQNVVYTSQGDFRTKIKDYRVPDQPAAIYLLRNYLRLCVPTTIEAEINTSATLVQRGVMLSRTNTNLVVANTVSGPSAAIRGATVSRSVFGADEATAALRKYIAPGSPPNHKEEVLAFLSKLGLDETDIPQFLNGREHAAQRLDLVNQLRRDGKL